MSKTVTGKVIEPPVLKKYAGRLPGVEKKRIKKR